MKINSKIKNLFLYSILIFSSTDSWATPSLFSYGALLTGSTSMTENSGGNTYKHENMFFIGHSGFAFGAGCSFTSGVIGISFKGEAAWIGDSIDRKNVSSLASSTYRDESTRTLVGAALSFKPGPISLDFDYYPYIQNNISYSDAKQPENPFIKNDRWKGSGTGVSIVFKFMPTVRNFITYRRLTYNEIDIAGAPVTLPSTQWSTLVFDEVLLGYGTEF